MLTESLSNLPHDREYGSAVNMRAAKERFIFAHYHVFVQVRDSPYFNGMVGLKI